MASGPKGPVLGRALITTFGLGHMRPASGTWGSLPPVGLALVLYGAGLACTLTWYVLLVLVTLVFSAACVLWGDWAEAEFNEKDPGEVVADETAGMAVTLLFLPAWALSGWVHVLAAVGGAFVLFRIMDILKPAPANGLQRVPGGWGILLDDLMAGIYAGAVLWVGCWWWLRGA